MPARLWIVLFCCLSQAAVAESPQQFAAIGDLRLVSGETLHDVRVGYRTAGTLNADKSNVIVFPTWFSGSSEELLRFDKIGPGKLADTERFFVIAIDALGNGVSTSPSNRERQAGADFPAIEIDDMVNAAHALVTQHLGIGHVHAVMGISMGGMQTFQWLGQYPDFMDKAVPIDGSPRMTSYDLALWSLQADAIELLLEAGVDADRTTRLASRIGLLNLWTPEYYVENIAAEDYAEWLTQQSDPEPMDPRDYLAQLRAMIAHDAYVDFPDADPPYAGRIKAQVLVVGVPSDHMVNPVPGKALAEAIGARYAEIHSNCGHIGSSCEAWKVEAIVNAFLYTP
ncbi:MAG: alpha/beta fold hydrolase [Lysobacterales bacterium]